MKIGVKGISYSTTERKYLVRVKTDSKRVYVGRYSSLEEAKEALASYNGSSAEPSDTPILHSIRSNFAPAKTSKSPKPSKVKSLETAKATKRTTNHLLKTVNTQKTKPARLSQETVETTTQADYHKVGENSLRRILSYLIKEADKRGTSVFDVVVQEVAKLSK